MITLAKDGQIIQLRSRVTPPSYTLNIHLETRRNMSGDLYIYRKKFIDYDYNVTVEKFVCGSSNTLVPFLKDHQGKLIRFTDEGGQDWDVRIVNLVQVIRESATKNTVTLALRGTKVG